MMEEENPFDFQNDLIEDFGIHSPKRDHSGDMRDRNFNEFNEQFVSSLHGNLRRGLSGEEDYNGKDDKNDKEFIKKNYVLPRAFNQSQLPERYQHYKLLPGVSGFFLCEPAERSYLDKISVEDNNIRKLDLNKMFEQGGEKGYENSGHKAKLKHLGHTTKPQKKNHDTFRKNSKHVHSFNEYVTELVYDQIQSVDFMEYEEFQKADKIMNHLENFLFLEKGPSNNNLHPEEEMYFFTKYFNNRYEFLLNKLKSSSEHHKLDFKMLLQCFWSFSAELTSDLLKFVKSCSSEFCFEKMKSSSREKKNGHKKHSPSVMIEQEEVDEEETKHNKEIYKKYPVAEMFEQQLLQSRIVDESKQVHEENYSNSNNNIGSSSLSASEVTSNINEKKIRKNWTVDEAEELNKLIKSYYPDQIPAEKLEEFAKSKNRTLPSIRSKVHKYKQASGIHASQNKSTNSLGYSKYDIPLDRMLKIGLEQFPEKSATKNELLKKVEEIFFSNNIQKSSDETWKKSALQLLGCGQKFRRTKGIFILCGNMNKYQELTIEDIKGDRNLSLKSKIIIVLQRMPDKRGDLKEITEIYMRLFDEMYGPEETDKNSALKKNIHKTLLQHPEFDKTFAKTIYSLT